MPQPPPRNTARSSRPGTAPASPVWHARIDHQGSGFLVSDRHVVTCAHVVHHAERVTIAFPGSPARPVQQATVVERGSWAGGTLDRGDVAVLELDRPVDLAPAVFADLAAPYASPPPKLVSYGFPRGYDKDGVQSELRATSHQLIAGEWTQVEAWTSYGQELARGFSGAAAFLEGSGAVVGMISSGESPARNGRMIPARVLARHLPRLAEHIPTQGYDAETKRRLYGLVVRATESTPSCGEPPYDLGELLRVCTGRLGVPVPADGPRTLWEAVWYLLSEAPPRSGALPLAELTVRLADRIGSASVGQELRQWASEHRAEFQTPVPVASPAPPPPPVPPPSPPPSRSASRRWSPILVEIERSGAGPNALLVEVSAYRDGCRRLVGEKRLTARTVQDWVLDRIDEAFGEIDTEGQELIAFALPRQWLNRPVDQWARRKGSRKPLGCESPVVVMDHDRRNNSRLQFKLKKIWDVLDGQQGSAVHRIGCGSGSAQRPDRLSVRLQDAYAPVGFARPPRAARDKELHRAALEAPAPIVLWPRAADCAGPGCDGSVCSGDGFLDALAAHLSTLPPGELPHHVFELRKNAFLYEGAGAHWAAELSLLWEDPRWFPDVRRLSHSPVG
ncbi:trypsin-like peptidase domain-containing protein [Streptomyces sp. NPDC021093]|uniref:VMAP-C domain-containing protein n=1 Tax=Streptomyces sp. NPDC021093 TaxID=3365112 RepID=UPI003794D973